MLQSCDLIVAAYSFQLNTFCMFEISIIPATGLRVEYERESMCSVHTLASSIIDVACAGQALIDGESYHKISAELHARCSFLPLLGEPIVLLPMEIFSGWLWRSCVQAQGATATAKK